MNSIFQRPCLLHGLLKRKKKIPCSIKVVLDSALTCSQEHYFSIACKNNVKCSAHSVLRCSYQYNTFRDEWKHPSNGKSVCRNLDHKSSRAPSENLVIRTLWVQIRGYTMSSLWTAMWASSAAKNYIMSSSQSSNALVSLKSVTGKSESAVSNLQCARLFSSSQKRNFVTSTSSPDVKNDLKSTEDFEMRSAQSEHYLSKEDGRSDKMDSDDGNNVSHVPVMVEEVLQIMQPENGQTLVDMTFGAGGHAKEILKIAPDVHYFASDRDPLAHRNALKFADEHKKGQVIPILGKFSEMASHLLEHGVKPGTVDGFLFDLGASSMQFDQADRGFSLSKDGPLDMRMDGTRFPDGVTAADVVNTLSPNDLAHILKKYGEERKSLQIAHAIVEAKYAFGNFTRTKQLADVVKTVFASDAFRHDKMHRPAHVATKTFQALRIFVNDELNEIHNGLEIARHFLKVNGCCVIISFHSLEDRIVKRHFHDIDIDEASNMSIHDHFRNAAVSYSVDELKDEFLTKQWRPYSRKVLEPTEEECIRNPRARSAKLRAAYKQNEDSTGKRAHLHDVPIYP